MRPEDVLLFVQQRPFQPYRITMGGGQTYDVRHPEMVAVSRTVMAVGIPPSDEFSVPDRLVTIALVHIVQIEPLPIGKPKSNGQG